MLKVYTSYNCSSCKKVMKWLDDSGIGYDEYNFFSRGLSEKEVLNILKYAHNGFEDVISERSNAYQRHKDSICEMTTKELIQFIIDNPAVLKRPILVDDVTEKMQIGYNVVDLDELL